MTGTLTLNPGDINLVTDPSIPGSGSILKNGIRFLHDAGAPSNTFLGNYAGNLQTTGVNNTAAGAQVLFSNTTGNSNTAIGHWALYSNTRGSANTAIGQDALFNNSSADANIAIGVSALGFNTTGGWNTAAGAFALIRNNSGGDNTVLGAQALAFNTTGNYNLALGFNSASNIMTGSNNIVIANSGAGHVDESNTIRIGEIQTATFIAGISGATVASGIPIYIDSSGQLGTLSSSVRFKDDVRDIGDKSVSLFKLRPVAFHYKHTIDPAGLEQYGLVAEEVAKIYPDLVTRDAAGQPQAVRYHFLVPMLLNEVQRDRKTIEEQRRKLQTQGAKFEEITGRVARLEALLGVSAR